MQYSIATVCLSGTLRQKIEAIAKAGFQGIEIFENDLITSVRFILSSRTLQRRKKSAFPALNEFPNRFVEAGSRLHHD